MSRPTIELFCLDGQDPDGAQRTLLHCAKVMPPGFFTRLVLAGPYLPENSQVEFVRANLFATTRTRESPAPWRYNKWIIQDFPAHIQADFVLVVHRDGYILHPDKWTDEFLRYDYIGAPWPAYGLKVGNGGFSLRSRRLHEFLKNQPFNPKVDNEDIFIAFQVHGKLAKAGMQIAPLKLAARFSCESTIPGLCEIENTFGFHAIEQPYAEKHPLRKFL